MNADLPLASAPTTNSPPPPATRRVVDAPTRTFHWLFALCFLGAYLTADGESWRLVHVTLGYTLAGLLAFRVVYGLVGPRHARLSLMLKKIKAGPQWLKTLHQLVRSGSYASINWQQGQNLGMGLAVVVLLGLVAPLTLSGYATFNDWGDFLGGDWIEEVHELVGNTYLAIVLAHLALMAGVSVLRQKNVAQPMLTGRVSGPGPDLAKRNHLWLALLLLVGVLAYWTWEWLQSPIAGMMKDTLSWSI
jgi:cytochrome b